MRRRRGFTLLSVILFTLLLGMLLSLAAAHFARSQDTLRRHDDNDAVAHALRGAVRWGQGVLERDPAFSGTLTRSHELGVIEVTVDARDVAAELRGRRVTWHRADSSWSEE